MAKISNQTYEALSELRARLPLLRDALVPGSPKRWSQPAPSPERVARLARLAREERLDREANIAAGVAAIGEGLAPLRLDVLTAETAIREGVAALEDLVCDWLGITPLDREASAARRITRLVGLLDRIAALDELAPYVLQEVRRLNRTGAAVLGELEPVRRIDARCPHCGALSLRALPERQFVVCVNSGCRCTDEGCVCAEGRRHTWPAREWPELAETLEVA